LALAKASQRMASKTGHEKILTLVKAQPHIGDQHGETVCCAGVTVDGEWRRLFPVIYRWLDPEKRFGRWNWIEYDWRKPSKDLRAESRHVQEETIQVHGKLKPNERASFLDPLVVKSTTEAAAKGQTLCLLRPHKPHFTWKLKSEADIADERAAYAGVCQQSSLFGQETPRPIEPCPYSFHLRFDDELGKTRRFTCDDWETAAMFFRFRKSSGEAKALQKMNGVFNEQYPSKGMAVALGTHSRRAEQWLLVGIIRLDHLRQRSLL
jgi:hypothetical protein